jgi:hypothetical protein
MKTRSKYVLSAVAVVAVLVLFLLLRAHTPAEPTKPEHNPEMEDVAPVAKAADAQTNKDGQANQGAHPKMLPGKTDPGPGNEFDDHLSDLVVKHPPPRQWEAVLADTEATIVELQSPAAPQTIEYKPALDKTYCYVTGTVVEMGDEEVRTLSRYKVLCDRDPNFGLVVTRKDELSWVMAHDSPLPYPVPNAAKLAVLRNRHLVSANRSGNRLVVTENRLNPLEAILLKPDLPEKAEFKVGTTWESGELEKGAPIKHTIAGYASVNGMRTVIVTSSCGDYGPVTDITSNAFANLKGASVTNKFHSIVYVSVDDGMIVRREDTVTLNIGNKGSQEFTILTQLAKTEERL